MYGYRVPAVNPTPGSQTSLREANRARIVDSLKHHGRLTQVELAGTTGLSPATVSNIVKELSAAGILHTTATSRSGRRAVQVSLARKLGLVAGVHFSSRHLRVAIADVTQVIVADSHVPLARDYRHDAELDRAALLLTDLAESLGIGVGDLQCIGLAVPAPLDVRSGRVATPWLMRGWENVEPASALSRRIGSPVYADSESNLGALAEARSGAGRGSTSMIYLRAGYTIGSGLILEGRPFHGFNGLAGQVGHMTLDENGAVCRCGSRGCLETVAAAPALLELFPAADGMHRVGDITAAAAAGDASSRRVLADAGRQLGIAVGNLCNIIDPERIVVGGELAIAGEILLSPLRHALERSALVAAQGPPEVLQGELGDAAELMGAIALAVAHVAVEPESVAAG